MGGRLPGLDTCSPVSWSLGLGGSRSTAFPGGRCRRGDADDEEASGTALGSGFSWAGAPLSRGLDGGGLSARRSRASRLRSSVTLSGDAGDGGSEPASKGSPAPSSWTTDNTCLARWRFSERVAASGLGLPLSPPLPSPLSPYCSPSRWVLPQPADAGSGHCCA
jgi:hypothetical protein